jgi:TolB-like protein/tetratricopeptide (TPR) repeat protein
VTTGWSMMTVSSLLAEARRRRVFRTAALYVVGAWVLVQIALAIFPALSISEVAIRYVWIAAILGFPIAIIFGWRYDIRGGRIVRTSDTDESASLSLQRPDYLILGALGIIAIVIVAGSLSEISDTQEPVRDSDWAQMVQSNSVAVLPFVNMSANPDNEYFADGLTEALLHALAQLPDLKVPARTSSFFFKGKNVDARDIARELGVSKLLEGSVQRSGNKVRIVAQLIEANTGFHLWSETYDRDMSDIFEVQDDIANMVATALNVTVRGTGDPGGGKIEVAGTRNVAAYDAYLRGQEQFDLGTYASVAQAEIEFKSALALDPDFEEASLGLAWTYVQMGGIGVISKDEAWQRAGRILEGIDDSSPEFEVELLNLEIRRQLVRAEDRSDFDFPVDHYIDRMIEVIGRHPNEIIMHWRLGQFLRRSGRIEEAADWVRRGLDIDPLATGLHGQLALVLERLGDLVAAEAAYKKVIELTDGQGGHLSLAFFYVRQNRPVDFVAAWRKSVDNDPLDPELATVLARFLYGWGVMDEGDKYLHRAEAIDPGQAIVRAVRAERYMLAGDYENARAFSEAMLREDIDHRWAAHEIASQVFGAAMVELGEIDEALEIINELQPGILSPGFKVNTTKELNFRFLALVLLVGAQPKDDARAMVDAFLPDWDGTGVYNIPLTAHSVMLDMLQGTTEAAVARTLAFLAGPGQVIGGYQMGHMPIRYYRPFSEIVLEPAVAPRWAEFEAAAKKTGDDVLAYLTENDLLL